MKTKTKTLVMFLMCFTLVTSSVISNNDEQPRLKLIEESLVKKGPTVRAAIDFGSGTVKIQTAVVDPAENRIIGQPLFAKYIPLRLSEDVASHEGRISDGMKLKANSILSSFKEEATAAAASQGYTEVEFSGIATAVFRKAENGKELLQQLEDTLGIPFRVLSQDEEGKIGFLAAKVLYPDVPEENLLVWDSGNGSFQFTTKENGVYKVYQGPLGHGTVRVLLSKEIRLGAVLQADQSGNPIQKDEALKTAQKIHKLLPEIPTWLQNKLNSKKTIIATFGDGESIFALTAHALGKSKGVSTLSVDTVITQQEALQVFNDYLGKGDEVFNAAGLHLRTETCALLLSTIMDHFAIQTIHYRVATGSTSGMLIMPELWKN